MHKHRRIARALLLATSVAVPAAIAGCATHEYYDPYYRDYHRWDNRETIYYNRWEVETHRPHWDYRRRNDADKRAYWQWRHEHREDK